MNVSCTYFFGLSALKVYRTLGLSIFSHQECSRNPNFFLDSPHSFSDPAATVNAF